MYSQETATQPQSGHSKTVSGIWEADITLFWLAGLNLSWGCLSHNDLWAHMTGGNYRRFSDTTDSPLTDP